MPRRHEHVFGHRLQFVRRPLDPHLQQAGPLPAVDRQEPVRGHPLDVLAEVEVVAIVFLILGQRLTRDLDPLALEVPSPVEKLPEPLPHVRSLAELVGDDVPDTQEHVCNGCHLGVGIDEISSPHIEIRRCRFGRQDLAGQRLELPLPGHLGERELPRLEGKVEILELLGALRRGDRGLQAGREPALPLDGPQDGLLAIGELSGAGHGLGDLANRLFVEAARLIAAIPRDERHGVATVEQFDRRLYGGDRKPEPLGYQSEVDDSSDHRGSHPTRKPRTPKDARAAQLSSAIRFARAGTGAKTGIWKTSRI